MESWKMWLLNWIKGSIKSYLDNKISFTMLLGRIERVQKDGLNKKDIINAIEELKRSSNPQVHDKLSLILKHLTATGKIPIKIGKYGGIKNGVGVKIPQDLLIKAGIKEGDIIKLIDENRKIIIGKKITGYERKVRKGGIIRIPNEITRRRNLLNKETEGLAYEKNGKIIIEF